MSGTREGGLKSALKTKERHGEDFYKRIGSQGGKMSDKTKTVKKVMERHGEDFYKRMGKLGGEQRKRNLLKKNSFKDSIK